MCDLCNVCEYLIKELKWPLIVYLSNQCDYGNFCDFSKENSLLKIKDCNMCDFCNLCDFRIRESKRSHIANLTNTCDLENTCDFSKPQFDIF